MPGRLQDKVAIVTGSSGAIGRAICLAYHAEGAKIVCADIQEKSASNPDYGEGSIATTELIKSKGGSAIYVQADMTQDEQARSLVEAAVKAFGRVDVMVNNAGTAPSFLPFWETSTEDWNKIQATNSTSVYLGSKYAVQQMLRQEPHPSGDRGWIVNTVSVLGLVGSAGITLYSASKGAAANFTRSAALDCGAHRIHVNAVCPGFTASAMTKPLFDDPEAKQRLIENHCLAERLGVPEDISAVCVFLASDDARWVTGVTLPVDGGYTAR